MDSVDTYWADRSALEWQVELGVTDAICDAPVNRYEIPDKLAKPKVAETATPATPPTPVATPKDDAVTTATALAAAASDLAALRMALDQFDGCMLKRGARNMIFGHGDPAARVMIVGEAPDRDEDRAGRPFVGDAGTLLTRMFAAIDLNIDTDLYLTAAMPWRVPTLPPKPEDMAMLAPFVQRHIALAQPDAVVVMGNTACQMVLGRTGVSRMRGQWAEVLGRPAMPMLHPQSLLQNPAAKRDAWADLLTLRAKLDHKP